MRRYPASALLLVLMASAVFGDDDHEQVLRWRREGIVLPLEQILDRLDPEQRARILEVELEQEHGRVIYEVKYVDRAGRIVELYLDARTGEPVELGEH